MAWDFELVAGPVGGTTEGPAWNAKDALLFSNLTKNRILRYEPATGETTEYRTETRWTNGLMFDSYGVLFGCRSHDQCIAIYHPDGTVTKLPNVIDGKRIGQTNDLAIDRQGRIWFGVGRGKEADEIDYAAIMRLDPKPDGEWELRRMTLGPVQPNGVLLSRDERTLYVAQSGYVEPVRELRAYPIQDDDTLGDYIVLHTWGQDSRGLHKGIDGMVLDTDGNIIACAGWRKAGPGSLIYVFAPTGQVLESHQFPVDRPTNITFGDPDWGSLYITSSGYKDQTGGYVFRVRNSGRRGWLPASHVLESSTPLAGRLSAQPAPGA